MNKPGTGSESGMSYGLDSPWHYYYRGAFADTVRSIDFVFAQPGFDGRNLFATGISQGRRAHAGRRSARPPRQGRAPIVPFLGDFPDYFRLVPWPGLAGVRRRRKTARHAGGGFQYAELFRPEKSVPAGRMPGVDGIRTADIITPPHTNFAAYNPIRAPKRWICYPESGHHAAYDNMDVWIAESTRFFREYMAGGQGH